MAIPPPLTPAQAHEIDRIATEDIGIPGLLLMENAGLRCAQWIASRFHPLAATILCGPGNNGGDGMVIARQLAVQGVSVRVVLAGDPARLSVDARTNWEIVQRLKLANLHVHISSPKEPEPLGPAAFDITAPDSGSVKSGGSGAVIVDALLGISATGAPRSPMDRWIEWANGTDATRVAIDVPTGIDPITGGAPGPAFRADWTLMIECPKPFADSADRSHVGQTVVIPLGLPAWVTQQAATHSP